MSVRTLVKSIQDIMRQDTGVDGDAQRISQLCWIFDLQSAGNAGEYYTPRAVTAFMVQQIDPHPGETLFEAILAQALAR